MEILSPAMHVPLMQPPSTAVNIITNTAEDKQLMAEINNTLRQLERVRILIHQPDLVIHF